MKKTLLSFCWAAAVACAGVACEPRAEQAAISGARPAHTGEASAGTVIEKAISWPDRSQIDAAARAALPPQARAAVSRSPVPVLVPREAALLGSATVVVKPHWYSLSGRHDGMFVVVSATRLVHRYDHITERPSGKWRVRGQDALLAHNRGIASVSWQERGATYTLELECADPQGDPRCADGDHLLGLAEGLIYVGGLGGAP